MHKLFLLLFINFFLASAQAQLVSVKEKASGYLGMKNSVGFRVLMSPSFQPQRQWDAPTDEEFGLSLNKGIDVYLQRSVGEVAALSVHAGFSGTSADISRARFRGDFSELGIPDHVENYNLLEHVYGTPKITDYYIGGNLKIYRKKKGALAPLGPYMTLGFRQHHIKTDISNVMFETTINNGWTFYTLQYQVKDPVMTGNATEINLGFGHCLAIDKRLFLDFGLEFGYLSYTRVMADSEIDGEISQRVFPRMRRKQLLNYQIGLAYPF